MNILSLFDGMACGMLAFQKAGVPVDTYTAYEIDKYAIQTATHNFPNIKECGDVFEADFTQYKNIDYIVGGSPCTYWSIAQKNNRETEASGLGWELFSQYVRAIKEVKPKFFIYENNKSMSAAIKQSISETFGFEPICINSALVSAQNRQRLYWVGRRNDEGTYSKVDVKQPEDKGILLKDILDGVVDRDKSRAIIGSIGRTTTREYFKKQQGQMSFEPVCVAERGKYGNDGIEQHYETREDGKSNVLTTVQKDNNVAELVSVKCRGQVGIVGVGVKWKSRTVESVSEPIRVGALPRPNGELSTSQAMRVYSTEGKSVNLVSGGGGMGGKTGLYAIPVEFKDDKPTKAISCADGKTYTVYEVKDGQITIKGKQYPIKLADGYYIIRKLTVSECKRLQTVPEWYEFPVSDTQAYKMLGNGWTINVITHLIEATLK